MTLRHIKGAILDSRLGACWKCMTLTGVLLGSSLGTVVVAASWPETSATNQLVLLGAVLGSIVFGLLGLAHTLTYGLRQTIWRNG